MLEAAHAELASEQERVRTWLGIHPDVAGLVLNAVAQFQFSLMALLIKLSGSFIGGIGAVFVRSVVQLPWGVAWTVFITDRGTNPFGPFRNKEVMLLLLSRATVGVFSMMCWFWSIHRLHLADATLVNFFAPVWTAVFGRVIMKERIGKPEIVGMCFSAAGILLVARPPFLLHLLGIREAAELAPEAMDSSASRLVSIMVGLAGTLFAGLAYVLTHKIGKRVAPTVIINWLSLAGCVLAPLPAVLLEGISMPKGKEWLFFFAIGTVAFGAQLAFTKALQTGMAARVIVGNYFNIIWAFCWGILVLHEFPPRLSLVGASLILVNGAIAVYKAFRVRPPRPAAIHSSAEVLHLSFTPPPRFHHGRV